MRVIFIRTTIATAMLFGMGMLSACGGGKDASANAAEAMSAPDNGESMSDAAMASNDSMITDANSMVTGNSIADPMQPPERMMTNAR